MDFDPLSDNEDDVTFMPEKKKKDKEEKRRKSKGSHKSDKRDKGSFSDGSTPTAMKSKNVVHGLVGPAEYIAENSPTHGESSTAFGNQPTSPTTNISAAQVFSQQQVTPQKIQQTSQVLQQQTPQQMQQQWTPQKHQQANNQQFAQQSNSTPNFQQLQYQNTPTSGQPFTANFNASSTKIERPHSSAALLQERTPQQSPQPFKQSTTMTQQKVTLLAQAMNTTPQPQPSPLPNKQAPAASIQPLPPNPSQLTAAINMTHHRNSSYSRAMSLPVESATGKQDASSDHMINRFHTKFDSELEVSTNVVGSPILENPASPFQRSDSLSSPPLTPNNKHSASQQELWNNAPPLHHAHHHHTHHSHEAPHTPKQHDGDWAHFSPQTEDVPTSSHPNTGVISSSVESDNQLPPPSNHIDIPRKRSQTESMASSSMASSIPESTSSVDSSSDNEEMRITQEQREYYTNQFKSLQPNEDDVIKGPQARDFFLKSNLAMETLSKIWHLSDLDKDGALNLEEFQIAMHLVVLIKHGYELPMVLPPSLLGQEQVHQMASQDGVGMSDEDEKLISDDEKQESGDWSAEFDATDGAPIDRGERTVQTYAQPSPTSVTVPSETRVQPVSHITEQQQINHDDENELPSSPGALASPNDVAAAGGKITAIARPRVTANKNVNLMDASPWQLLPPPSGKTGKFGGPNGGTTAKKALKMDSVDSELDSAGVISDSENNKLVSIDNHMSQTTSPTNGDSSLDNLDDDEHLTDDHDHERLKVKKKDSAYFRNLSKEKSRSIDSLRSDISESSMFEWKRQSIRRESRPRSFNGESTSHDTPQFESPPVPPPRTNKGHARASSLDFNQMFHNRSPRVSSEPKLQVTTPTDGTGKNPITLNDSVINEKPSNQRVKTLGSPLTENARVNSKEHVRFMEEPEVLSNNTKSPMEIQMRKHELQARLRDLKTKNSTLSSLISQLGMEWKEVCEERISLEIRLQRAQQELE
ncbi:ralBP1-associated Eps domain-containing protein 1-like isoform X3 [Clytia hemisphaerica]|uniref:ralBP1-associated Eps domain-containing protein 1-like isoform X3 n=1 Tax=Clytia hemisphaerica TaxID=252671 RepID=UPI0034D5B22E